MGTRCESNPNLRADEAMSLRFSFTIVVEEDEGAFHAYSPAFKGLHVDGETEEEALRNAIGAAQCYIRSMVRNGEPLPIGQHLSAERADSTPKVPFGALLKDVEMQWPSLETSGTS